MLELLLLAFAQDDISFDLELPDVNISNMVDLDILEINDTANVSNDVCANILDLLKRRGKGLSQARKEGKSSEVQHLEKEIKEIRKQLELHHCRVSKPLDEDICKKILALAR